MHPSSNSSRRFAVVGATFVAVAAGVVMACSAPGSSPPAGTGSGNGSSGTSEGNPTTTTAGPVAVPFNVSDVFVPSGFMGDAPTDFNGIKMSSDSTTCIPRQAAAKGSCYSVSWTPSFLSGAKSAWVGVYWQYPSNNWGGKPGKTITGTPSKVTFTAAGAAGGEVVQFLVGGVNDTPSDAGLAYADTFMETTTATLTTSWTQYEIPLTGDMDSSVIGGFAWTITTSSTSPVTFYIDDVEWE